MQNEQNSRDYGDLLFGGVIGVAIGAPLQPARKLASHALEAIKGDWFEIIKAEHQIVEELFDRLLQTQEDQTNKRQMLLTKIAYALNKHAVMEENVIYPARCAAATRTTPYGSAQSTAR